jgi:phosphoribosylformylglycinamidine synthase PurS subunit
VYFKNTQYNNPINTKNMKFKAEINVMPLKEILDPQGKAVKLGLNNLGIKEVADVRIGKHITMELEAANQAEAEKNVETACKKLLANLIMEGFTYSVAAV